MRRHGRTDANQAAIVAALRAAGRSVQILSAVGRGCPDLLVGWPGHLLLMEVKTPTGALTDDQTAWLARWRGPVAVVRSVADALAATGVVMSAGHAQTDTSTAPGARTQAAR